MLIDIRGLKVSFPGKENVLKDFSLKIAKGEIVALVGESGSGKTLLASTLVGMLEPPGAITGGSIIFNPSNDTTWQLHALKEKDWGSIRGKGISLIFQDHMNALDPITTIGSQFRETIKAHLPLYKKSEAEDLALELLNKVFLPDPKSILTRYPFQLSGGMRQRVMIAMALCHKPKLLIADEPTTALDLTIQGQILKLLFSLKEEMGMSILFITHDLAVARLLADRVAIIREGSLVEVGPAEDIFDKPRQPYTQALLQAIRRLSL